MPAETIVFSIFLIFTGAAVLSTLVLYTRQSLLVAYMLVGVLLGPWALKLVTDATVISQIGEVGIIFLLFLLGLHLHPQNLLHMLRKVTIVALITSIVFAGMGYGIGILFGFTQLESLIIGAAMMFSSTIIGLKLLPTTILHHQHTGEVMISVLLMQDLIAIVVLLMLNNAGTAGALEIQQVLFTVGALPTLLLVAFLAERYVLVKLLQRFDTIQEYIFLLSIGWCLGFSELSVYMGLSEEIGAFIAGVALASSPIALYIAESLKPLRDFFLVLFFFSIGASFDIGGLDEVLMPALLLAGGMLLVKPYLFKLLLHRAGENKKVSWEVGTRLGQASEFSLLVAYIAMDSKLISSKASALIQAATILTFIVSSYLVVWRYPTPVATTERMRKD